MLSGILSLLVGTAFASPLLISELAMVPFWTIPDGPKADLSVNVAYANFAIQENASDNVRNGYNRYILDYYVVLNVTNHSDMPTTMFNLEVVPAKDMTVVPSALGGRFFGTAVSGITGTSFGPTESYAGHVGAARVEGVWLDGEWINATWVPEGGLAEIWNSEDIFPPKGIEDIWQPHFYSPGEVAKYSKPFSEYRGTFSNNTMYCSYSGTVFSLDGGNYWIEGVPLKEYVVNNEVKSTIVYYNGSWVDATDRVEIKEKPYVTTTDTLAYLEHRFGRKEESDDPTGGRLMAISSVNASFRNLPLGFDNTWGPHQSRLVLLTGSVGVASGEESLNNGEIAIYAGAKNYIRDDLVNVTLGNTESRAIEYKTVPLEVTEDGYLYNEILADDQMFVTDSYGIEVFIEPRD
jgi:hypothetical protein